MDTKLDQETFAAHVSTPSVTKEVYILTPPSSGRTGRVTNFHNIHDLATPSNRTPLPSVLHYSPISEDEGNSSNIGYESCVGTDHSFHGGNNLFSSPVLQKSESEVKYKTREVLKETPETERDNSQCNTKKSRTIYKAQQVYVLEKIFRDNQYPESDVIEKLARDLCITETKVKIWFQNKRARWRRREVETSKLYQNTQLYLAGHQAQQASRLHQPPPALPQMQTQQVELMPQIMNNNSFLNNSYHISNNHRNYESFTHSSLFPAAFVGSTRSNYYLPLEMAMDGHSRHFR